MIKVLFVCLGNICRSPMAKFVFKDLIEEQRLSNKFYIDSAATSYEEIGNDMHYGTKDKLTQKGIHFTKHKAKRITVEDYNKFDFIIGMEERNVKDIIKIIGSDTGNKVFRMLDFSDDPRDIADPWYTGNFEVTYNDIIEGCNGFMKYLNKENLI